MWSLQLIFKVRNSKNFLGRGSPSPLPRPLPPLFLGLRPRFGLHPQISGASRPRFGLRPIRTPQLLKRGCALARNRTISNVHRQMELSGRQAMARRSAQICHSILSLSRRYARYFVFDLFVSSFLWVFFFVSKHHSWSCRKRLYKTRVLYKARVSNWLKVGPHVWFIKRRRKWTLIWNFIMLDC